MTQAWILVGLGWGDEGKGSLVDALIRRLGHPRERAPINVRFNGGPQAAHHVVSPYGRRHCFSQVGAGSFNPGVQTYVGPACFFDPLALSLELDALRRVGVADAAERLRVHPQCAVLTPWHALANRAQECRRGPEAHGSCGRGIGACFADVQAHPRAVLRASDLADPRRLMRRLRSARERMLAEVEPLALADTTGRIRAWLTELDGRDLLEFLHQRLSSLAARGVPRLADLDWLVSRRERTLVFEGAQGAMLDMEQGDWPSVTPSRTTTANAEWLLDAIGFQPKRRRIGVLRAYATRHGAGPFVSEAAELKPLLAEPDNRDDGWQGAMRLGWFDLVAAQRAIAMNPGLESVALTCVDRLSELPRLAFCDGYRVPESGPAHQRHAPDWAGAPEVSCSRDAAGVITRLQLAPGLAPGSRQALTRYLGRCRARLREAPHPQALIEQLKERLDLPVSCLSKGRTAFDKHWLHGHDPAGKMN